MGVLLQSYLETDTEDASPHPCGGFFASSISTNQNMTTINDLTKSIFLNAVSSADTLSEETQKGQNGARNDLHTYITYEFAFLFIHLLNRECLSNPVLNTLEIDLVASNLINASVHAMYKASTEEEKEMIRKGMYENLNEAEQRYGKCTRVLNTDNPFSDDAIFSVFGKYILSLLEIGSDPFRMTKIMEAAMTGWFEVSKEVPSDQ
jgi:hypothetical protein